MRPRFAFRYAALVACALVVAPMALQADDSRPHQEKLNGGYYLLQQLSEDEDQLPMIFVVKHAPQELHDFADQISRAAKETLARIEQFHDADPALRFDKNPLPQIEQDVRDSIKADKQHQLLFGTSDAEFARALIVSQIEATSYATHLAKVLGQQETDPGRKKALRYLAEKWGKLREHAFFLLRNY